MNEWQQRVQYLMAQAYENGFQKGIAYATGGIPLTETVNPYVEEGEC